MFPLVGNTLSEILRKEDEYIEEIKRRWKIDEKNPFGRGTEAALRMGKRLELLGDAQRAYMNERKDG